VTGEAHVLGSGSMTAEDIPGELIATGRSADVFTAGDDRVLRRYRTDHDVAREAETMAHVGRHGYPVPRVHAASGRDLLMDRIAGPTMLEHLTRRPWELRRQARLLAELQRQLAAVPLGPLGSPADDGADSVIVHGDHHPANVILSPQGPVVIDWTRAHAGPIGSDPATTWCLIHAADAPVTGTIDRAIATAGRRLLLRAFLTATDRDVARRALPAVVERRQEDANLSEAEKQRMVDLLARA
jgi:aminoglycoside phosphotransferase (APT) family kinase protein